MLNKKIKELVNFYDKMYEESFSEKKDKKFWFLFFSGFVSFMFFLLFALVGKNPFSLLMPFSIYDNFSLIYDKRSPVTVYLSDGKKNLFHIKRKIFLTGEIYHDLKALLVEISEPPFYELEENLNIQEAKEMKKLPNLHFALIQMWILKDKTLILDFREETLLQEMQEQRVRIDTQTYDIKEENSEEKISVQDSERNKKILEKMKIELMESAFLALEKTIFENFPDILSIEYRLNGISKELPNFEYKFTQKRTRL